MAIGTTAFILSEREQRSAVDGRSQFSVRFSDVQIVLSSIPERLPLRPER